METKCSGLHFATSEWVDVIYGSSIRDLTPSPSAPPSGAGRYLAPGFIDLQVNGFAGVGSCSPHSPAEEISRSIRAQFATGVTRIFPTVITGSREDMLGAIQNLVAARESIPEREAIAGLHIEGPHISPDDGPRGAHPEHCVRPPDVDEYRRWQEAARGLVRLVTVSPEWPGANAYIETLVKDGVVIAIGHTKATPEQVRDAVRAGATMSTHLGNGAHFMIQRHPNYIWEQLAEDRLAASFIVDGIHLPDAFLRVALRAKPRHQRVLITDAVMPAGCAPGPYLLGEVEVELLPSGDKVVLRGRDRLAGSALHMHKGVENLMRHAQLSLEEAVEMATINPARATRIAGRLQGLVEGELADLVEFSLRADGGIAVHRTVLNGQTVYEAH